MNQRHPDFIIEGSTTHRSVWMVRAMTQKAKNHIRNHISMEFTIGHWVGDDAVAVDHRQIADLVQELRTAGFIVRV